MDVDHGVKRIYVLGDLNSINAENSGRDILAGVNVGG